MADQIQTYLREQMPVWKAGIRAWRAMKVAVMGCVVNGPGESKHSNIGISLPGTFEEPVAPVYVDGRLLTTLRGDRIVAEFIGILDEYVGKRVVEAKARRQSAGEQIQAILENLHESGCLVKDLDTGLVDFPTLFRGQEVYLCWKLGEPAIRFWHGVQEGFAGRKPVDQDFLDHHEGDRSS
jgi:hypothetical protein